MSRYERYGTRSLVFSKWHRFRLGDREPMIDLDCIEYCAERSCSRPLVLIETARDVGQANKPTTVLRRLAEQAGVRALCVLYLPAEGVDLESGCACKPGRVDDQCPHGIVQFRVRRVWPNPEKKWRVMSPAEFRARLLQVRRKHIAEEHRA